MAIIWACGAILAVALVLGLRWCRLPFAAPPALEERRAGSVAQRYLWYCSLLLGAGVAAGISVIGCGGRLAMRLLAATAGDPAQGRITEADEIVGEVTVEGTIGFVLFQGIITGIATAAIYLVIRRLLPARAAGGLAFGAGLLLVLGTTSDPLRDENPDFDIVGPGWLSLLVFVLLALAYGLVLAGFVARLSAWLPLPSTDGLTIVRYLPIVLVALLVYPATILLAAIGVIVVLVTRWHSLVAWFRSPLAVRVGQVLLLVLVALSLPNALQSLADIARRGPA
jgi:hypothetical protein